MTASFVVGASPRFAQGATIGAYASSSFPFGGDYSAGPPVAAVTTAVVAADGTASFVGLAYDTAYLAGADVGGGVWRYIGFHTGKDPELADATLAELDAKTLWGLADTDTGTARTDLDGFFWDATSSKFKLRNIASFATTSYQLGVAAAAGDVTVTLDRPPADDANVGMVAIGVGTAQCELRTVTVVAGSVITVGALSYAHVAKSRVVFFGGDVVPAAWWAIKGDGSDEILPLQEAATQTANRVLWLSLQNKTVSVSSPLIVNAGQGQRICEGTVLALGGFAPVDSPAANCPNATLMSYNGTAAPFTADATADTITFAAGYTAPNNGTKIVIGAGASVPAGVTAGRAYFVVGHSGQVVQLALTSGGAAIDITGSGSGIAYPNVYALGKLFLRNFTINCAGINGLTALIAQIQQQSEFNRFRWQNCIGGYGIWIGGQWGYFLNCQSINCTKAIVLDNMSFCWFYGGSHNQCDRAVWVAPASSMFGGSAQTVKFFGVHAEMSNAGGVATSTNQSTATSVAYDLEGNHHNVTFDSCWFTLPIVGQKAVWIHPTIPNSGGAIRDAQFNNTTNGIIAISDDARGILRYVNEYYKRFVRSYVWNESTTSSTFYDPAPDSVQFAEGGSIGWGSANDALPKWHASASDNQTGDQASYRGKRQAATAADAGDLFTAVAHGLLIGNVVTCEAQIGQTMPGGLDVGRVFYVKTVPSADTFTISATPGGATFAITADGGCYIRTSRFGVNRNGYPIIRGGVIPTDAEVNNAAALLWFDATNGAAKLMIKAKQADGTVRTASIALA